jgi:hypothetical protein
MMAGVKDRSLGDAVKCACGAAVWCKLVFSILSHPTFFKKYREIYLIMR